MTTTLETHASRTRCHECGSTDVKATCHHCGKPLCENDLQPTVDAMGRPLSKEFAEFGLEKLGPPQHCADCVHVVRDDLRKYLIGGAAALALGLPTLMFSITFGLILLLGGAATAGVAYYLGQQRSAEANTNRQPVPVAPSVDSVRLTETVQGTLVLADDGSYRTSVTPVSGELELAMIMGKQDRDRVDLYRRKYRLGPGEPMAFSAGFVVLEGPAALQFLGEPDRMTVVPLGGKVADHPFFGEVESKTAAQWNIRLTHELRTDPEVDFVPVWLTPTLLPESDRRALELDVQWNDLTDDDGRRSVVINRIESLKIAVPIAWGNVEHATGRATIGTMLDERGEPVRTIEWTKVSITDDGSRHKRRTQLSVRFEKQIELSDVISGDLEVIFDGALSGVRAVHLHHSLGGRWSGAGRPEITTVVRAAFQLSLAGIRYQDVRLVPDRKKTGDNVRVGKDEFEGVVPDYRTVIDLTNTMADEGYYVKRMIESPPGLAGRADVINRVWDIAGRRYDGVYPVDFHVVLTGEERYGGGGVRAATGITKTEITVQGAYASDAMEERIVREWDQLHELTRQTLLGNAGPAESGAAFVPPQPPPRQEAPPVDERSEHLRKLLDDARNAVVAGRISEGVYREIKEQVERELRDL